MKVVKLHEFPEYFDDCCDLINNEWPRSKTARMRSLETSTDTLPTCLVMTHGQKVIGHGKLSRIPSITSACFVESVVIHPAFRSQGLGRQLMLELENHAKSLGVSSIYLSTIDKQMFYNKLGYVECEPVSIYGSRIDNPHARISKTASSSECQDLPLKPTKLEDPPSTISTPQNVPSPPPLPPITLPCTPPPPPPPPFSLFLSKYPSTNSIKKSTIISKKTFMRKDLIFL